MSPFRDDLEAALARADALERENRALRGALERASNTPQPAATFIPKPTREAPWRSEAGLFVGCVIATFAILGVLNATAVLGNADRGPRVEEASKGREVAEWSQQQTQHRSSHSLGDCILNAHYDEAIDGTVRSRWEEDCADRVRDAIASDRLTFTCRQRLEAWARSEHELADLRRVIQALPGAGPLPSEIEHELAAVRRARADALSELDIVSSEWLESGF